MNEMSSDAAARDKTIVVPIQAKLFLETLAENIEEKG